MSHVSACGELPGWLGVAVPWVLSLMVCTILAGRGLSLLKLSVAVVVSQLLFHTHFAAGTVATTTSGPMPAEPHPHGAMQVTPAPDTAVAMVHADPTIWLWHGLAAVVTVAVLYRGERAVLRLREVTVERVAWVRRSLVQAVPVPILAPSLRVVADTSLGWSVAPAQQLTLLRRRGPPHFLRALNPVPSPPA